MRAVPFLYFARIKREIAVANLRIKSVPLRDASSYAGARLLFIRGFSFNDLHSFMAKHGVSDQDSIPVTIVEYRDDRIPEICIQALFELAFGSWKQVADRSSRNEVYSLTKPRLRLVEKGYHLLAGKASENSRFSVALQRWAASYSRADALDSVLDCCSSLEALLHLGNELRLRLALSVYNIVKTNKKACLRRVYTMYGIRNDFIHGGSVPAITKADQERDIELVASVLLQIIRNGRVPNGQELNKRIMERYT